MDIRNDRTGALTVTGELIFNGLATGLVTVADGAVLTFNGSATEGIRVEAGGTLMMFGHTTSVENAGTAELAGMIEDRVIEHPGSVTNRHRGASIGGQIQP